VQVTCMCVRVVHAFVVQVNRVRHHHVRAVLRALEKSGFVDVVPGPAGFFFF
jgi:DNA-binding IscR family transcriptional regulator